mgnify:FL=1
MNLNFNFIDLQRKEIIFLTAKIIVVEQSDVINELYAAY